MSTGKPKRPDDLKKLLSAFDKSVTPEQRDRLRIALGNVAWGDYEKALASDLEPDDRAMVVLRFALSAAPNEHAMKSLLNEEQCKLVDEIGAVIRREFIEEEE